MVIRCLPGWINVSRAAQIVTKALSVECAHVAASNVRNARPNDGSLISFAPGPNARRTQSKCSFSMVHGGSDTVRICCGSVSIGQRLGSVEPSAIAENEISETTGSFNDAPDDNRRSASIHHSVLRRSKPVGRAPFCNAISISTSIPTPPLADFHGPGWCWWVRSGLRKASMYGAITWAYVLRRTNPPQISNSSTGSTAPANPPNTATFSGCIWIAVMEARVGSEQSRDKQPLHVVGGFQNGGAYLHETGWVLSGFPSQGEAGANVERILA